ncbi:hypothetical protein OHB26_23005 [Nocardia sp. NBC_01503]|uniref:hypothetical protein n=1 Tax=Nocardia sp. NBC_01503 TaxID=2975997 RepID=UPI002E7B2B2B|nr:hypothetical protein [Nocardia sp. NBC_01503]WTL29826.1 hypothetical protein OHB26_23005 [Nocardia sp. NBC_01503]
MFCVASLVPSPPALVSELGGAAGAAADSPVTVLRGAVLKAVGELAGQAKRWIVVGVAESDGVFDAETAGTFRGYGVDVRIGLSEAANLENPDPALPLPVLIGGWLREQVAPDAVAVARLVAADTPAKECLEYGARLRAEVDSATDRYGVLVVGDGAATLSLKAPRYLDPRAEAAQADIDLALSTGDRAALASLDQRLCEELDIAGRPAFQVLAGLFTADHASPTVETLYAAAPFGVAYHASVWHRGSAA